MLDLSAAQIDLESSLSTDEKQQAQQSQKDHANLNKFQTTWSSLWCTPTGPVLSSPESFAMAVIPSIMDMGVKLCTAWDRLHSDTE